MTLKQKQALLSYLGYYDGPLDGLWGEKSQRATIDFQRDYMEQEDALKPGDEPTQADRIEAQVMYTALMTDTLLDMEV